MSDQLKLGDVVVENVPDLIADKFKEFAVRERAARSMLVEATDAIAKLWRDIIHDYQLNDVDHLYRFNAKANTIEVVGHNEDLYEKEFCGVEATADTSMQSLNDSII